MTNVTLPLSVLAEAPSDAVSDKYTFIPTTRVLNVFESKGWNVVEAQQLKPKTRNPLYVRHQVTLEHPELSALGNEERFRITVINSHDASSTFKFMFGPFRLVCSNGLMVGHAWNTSSIRHIGFTTQKVNHALEETIASIARLQSRITEMKLRQLDVLEVIKLYDKALALMGLSSANTTFNTYDALTLAKRQADQGQDLWTVFNRVQEYCIRGGIKYSTFNNNTLQYRQNSTRAVTSIQRQVNVNRKLWDIAETFLNEECKIQQNWGA